MRDSIAVTGGTGERIARIAKLQRGRVARRQLLSVGISAEQIMSMLRRGLLHREHAGVSAVGHDAPTELGRETAGLLAAGERAVLSHYSAAALCATVVEQTRAAFLSIGEAVSDMVGRVEQIAASAHELAGSAEQLNRLVGQFKVADADPQPESGVAA